MNHYAGIKTDYASKSTVVKRYSQNKPGSAYLKVAGHLLSLISHGVNVICVIYSGDKTWSEKYRGQVELVQSLFPNISLNFEEE